MNERILVVDDEKAIADLVGIYLTKEGFDVQVAYGGADAAKEILEQEFDLALLDVMLPDIDGFELLRTIRSSHTYPVIMLTARDAQQDKIEVYRLARTITWLSRSARWSSSRACTLSFAATPATVAARRLPSRRPSSSTAWRSTAMLVP